MIALEAVERLRRGRVNRAAARRCRILFTEARRRCNEQRGFVRPFDEDRSLRSTNMPSTRDGPHHSREVDTRLRLVLLPFGAGRQRTPRENRGIRSFGFHGGVCFAPERERKADLSRMIGDDPHHDDLIDRRRKDRPGEAGLAHPILDARASPVELE